MFVIGSVLVSDEVVEEQFLCNLQACKGACCWEGDYGAPLESTELTVLDEIYPQVKPFLTAAGQQVLETVGRYVYYDDAEEFGTPLVNNGPCAYMTVNAEGIAQCGIEQAYQAGVIDFPKPVSCHLYPIRVRQETPGFTVLNYDRWDICSAACSSGKAAQLPVYQFLRVALERKFGPDFFAELSAAVAAHSTTD